MTALSLGVGLQNTPSLPALAGGGGGPAPNSPPVIPNITLQFDIIHP